MNFLYRAILFILFFIPLLANLLAQKIEVDKIEPPNWWVGMKQNKIQLMLYGNNLTGFSAQSFGGIKIDGIHSAENSSYAFIDIEIIDSISAGDYKIILIKDEQNLEINYPLLERSKSQHKQQGFDAADVVYLITPDRFVNGDTTNDIIPGMINEYDLANPYGRHGGDIQGIIDKLDYLSDLGVTVLWINPLVENNTKTSYHGYAATDLYNIDPRFGTNELYKNLVDEAHNKNLKIIFDHVNNHISLNHPWLKNLPMKDWLNGTKENYILANHNKISISDIHSDSTIQYDNIVGWFVDTMPDLNQKNPYVSKYLIQNTIWWIEYSGMDGIREDTYPYSDQKYLSVWAKEIFNEYPNFNIVGEIWIEDPIFTSYYQKDSFTKKDFNTNLPSITDFTFNKALINLLSGTGKIKDIYECLAKDFIYPNPQNLLTFLDNHDMQRVMYYSSGDLAKVKLALTLLLTSRGIPQIYYGTEIGMKGGEDHGRIREDFPGGFPNNKNDKRNAFTYGGRTEFENNVFNFTKELLHLRKKSKAFTYGKLIHFLPEDEVYIYFRIHENEKFMIILNNNNNNSSKHLNLKTKKDILKNTIELLDISTNEKKYFNESINLNLDAYASKIFKLIEK